MMLARASAVGNKKAAIAVLCCLTLLMLLILSSMKAVMAYTPCKCVIIRVDDISDWPQNEVPKIYLMDYFLSRNITLDAAIIVGALGYSSDKDVLNKVKEGFDRGVFELSIHGWRHDHYKTFTKEQQIDAFTKSRDRLQLLFGDSANTKIFSPPFNEFNAATIEAMAAVGLDQLGTTYAQENKVVNPYKITTIYSTDNSKIWKSDVNGAIIYHTPMYNTALSGLIFKNNLSGDALVTEVKKQASIHISKYGYFLLTVHPKDVSVVDSTGFAINKIDQNRAADFDRIITELGSAGYGFVGYRNIMP